MPSHFEDAMKRLQEFYDRGLDKADEELKPMVGVRLYKTRPWNDDEYLRLHSIVESLGDIDDAEGESDDLYTLWVGTDSVQRFVEEFQKLTPDIDFPGPVELVEYDAIADGYRVIWSRDAAPS